MVVIETYIPGRSGCIPITTCSPHNFDLVKSYGAEQVYDYHDPASSVDQIKAYTGNALDYALDCVCDAASMNFCYNAIGRFGGKYTALQPYQHLVEHLQNKRARRVKADWILGSALFGKKINWKEPYNVEADPELRVFGEEWFRCAQRLLDRGEIRPHPVRVDSGDVTGFEGVLRGLEVLKSKGVSGEKLVYRIP